MYSIKERTLNAKQAGNYHADYSQNSLLYTFLLSMKSSLQLLEA